MRPWIRSGNLLVVGLVLLPVALNWLRLAMSTGGPVGWLTGAQRASGLLALSTLLVSALLSVRVPRIDRFFGGLTRLWRVHHVLGLVSFLLVMAHVLLVGLTAIDVSRTAAIPAIFPPLSEWPLWSGWLAFFCLVVFLAPTFKFFGEPPYQRWKRLHLVSAVAIVLSLAHALPLSSRPQVWWLLGALAMLSILWRKLFSRFLACRTYRVLETTPLATGIVELRLRAEGRPLRYQAGQFFYLTPYDPSLAAGHGEEHPYTASSAPTEGTLRIGIKALGDATLAIQSIQIGSHVLVEGPYGHFFERLYPRRDQLWIGGGIGITPFVGAARELHASDRSSGGSIHLFYLADSPDRAYYLETLRNAIEGVANIRVTPHYFKEEGPISVAFMERNCPDFVQREVYLCGPPPMTAHVRKTLRRHGVPRSRIHSEDFNLL